MSVLVDDLRFALRLHRRRPRLAVLIVLTLGLGIGATTSIFSAVQAGLIRALPYPDADRLVFAQSWRSSGEAGVSWLDYADWRSNARTLEDLACYFEGDVHVGSADASGDTVAGVTTTRNLFSILGVRPLIGRFILADEAVAGAPPVVVISQRIWATRYGSDPTILGRLIEIEGVPHTVVGVLPTGFAFPRQADLWIPLEPLEGSNARSVRGLEAVGRLRSGIALEQANADLQRVARQLEQQNPATNAGVGARVIGLRAAWTGELRSGLLIVLGACSVLLLIACANVANLLLARAAGREREIAVRVALGAARARIVRQLLTESIVLALAGGALGVALTAIATHTLVPMVGKSSTVALPYWMDVRVDLAVLAFAVGVSTLVGAAFGLAPIVPALRLDLRDALKDGARGGSSRRGGRVRRALVVAEIALALTLLVAAGLLAKSLVRLWNVDPGFKSDQRLTFTLRTPFFSAVSPEERMASFRAVHRDLQGLPGVKAVGANSSLPLTGEEVWKRIRFTVEGAHDVAPVADRAANLQRISATYFEAVGIRLLRGRGFDDRVDLPGGSRSVVVSRRMADALWPQGDAVGQRLVLGTTKAQAGSPAWTVIGVADDVRHRAFDTEPGWDVYVSCFQSASYDTLTFVVQTAGDPMLALPAVRATIARVSSDLLVEHPQPMAAIVARSLSQARAWGSLFGGFSLLALVLAAIGVYGVMSHAVSERAREIGLRAALGASRSDLALLVLGDGLRLTALGVGVGAVAALVLCRLLGSLLYTVNTTDVWTYVGVSVGLTVIAGFATWLPARRAMNVDPAVAFRAAD